MKMTTGYRIILASESPRRQQLLRDMEIDFEVKTKPVDETIPEGMEKTDVALFLCQKKSDAFSDNELKNDELLITADTVVCLGNEILNKPATRAEAIEMLEKLAGNKHEVITGLCLRTREKKALLAVSTDVYFKPLTRNEIEHYVDLYKPFDKAGSYGIQEWIGFIGIDRIDGSYYNVVGLPTARLYEALKNF